MMRLLLHFDMVPSAVCYGLGNESLRVGPAVSVPQARCSLFMLTEALQGCSYALVTPRSVAGHAGRNIHALDPYRMPSQAALERGNAVGAAILQAHRDANGGAWPETVAVSMLAPDGPGLIMYTLRGKVVFHCSSWFVVPLPSHA